MSGFWEYFRDRLRYPLIQGEGALPVLVRGGAGALDDARNAVVWLRDQFSPDRCDGQFLDRHAASRGIRRWPEETDAFYRARVCYAYAFQALGGKAHGVREILRLAGCEAEIWEPRDVQRVLEAAGALRLDGGWQLDGGKTLRSVATVSGLTWLGWAEFGVRINLASRVSGDQDALLVRLIYAYKPARSMPRILYFLSADLFADMKALYSGSVVSDSALPYPRHTPRLDGGWRLGRDAKPVRVGDQPLNGSWRVGGWWPGQASGTGLEQLDVLANASIHSHSATASHCRHVRIGEAFARLDGGWQVGGNGMLLLTAGQMGKTVSMDVRQEMVSRSRCQMEIRYPASPVRLDGYPQLDGRRRLDGGWRAGGIRGARLDGSWRIWRSGMEASARSEVCIRSDCGRPHTLASAWGRVGASWALRLDGAWRIGARHRLDGNWRLEGGYYLMAERLGRRFRRLDGGWQLGFDRRLSGGWRLGGVGLGAEGYVLHQ
ncbi:MAG: phage tail protein [Tenuifilaceae bacterium]|nr:phage tail protein [Tenuifilaceae bacterium]